MGSRCRRNTSPGTDGRAGRELEAQPRRTVVDKDRLLVGIPEHVAGGGTGGRGSLYPQSAGNL